LKEKTIQTTITIHEPNPSGCIYTMRIKRKMTAKRKRAANFAAPFHRFEIFVKALFSKRDPPSPPDQQSEESRLLALAHPWM